MSYETILYEKQGHVARIIANRPEVRNAQSRLMLEEIDNAFREADADDDVRVIVVGGKGQHFSAGHDLGSKDEMADRETRGYPKNIEERVSRSRRLYLETTLRWRNISKPTIAMVQGYCIMGGLMLACACDIIIAAEDARFSDRSVRQGSPHVQIDNLPWEVGIRKAKEILWTGDFFDAHEALRLGLVNRVVTVDKLETETMELANRIALQEPFVVRMSKASLNATQDMMGYTNAVSASFRFHNLTDQRRNIEGFRVPRKEGESVADWVARRDKEFGDHKG
ncbi:MAG: enoyl-CoA hydratase [Dehalococcoidia bacterium]|nr:enoyl-CoA hydratase [Dehalococcoidia bacterium]